MKISKLFFAFMILSLALNFSACSSDDDDDNSIVGTWTFSNLVASSIKTNSTENDAKLKAYIEESEKAIYQGQKITFTEDGKVTIANTEWLEQKIQGTYTFAGGVLTMAMDYGDDGIHTQKHTVSLDKNTLNIKFSLLEDVKDMYDSELAAIGITDPNFTVTEVEMTASFTR